MPYNPNVELAVNDSVREALQRDNSGVKHVQHETRLAGDCLVRAVNDCREPANDESGDIHSQVVHNGVVCLICVFILVGLEATLHVNFDEDEKYAHGDAADDDPEVKRAKHPP